MCGLVYVMRKDGYPAYKAVLKRYRAQKGRGTEGYGYVAIKNNRVVSYERAQTEQEIIRKLQKEDAPEIMFHHRAPTSTPNIEEAAHPILVEHKGFQHQYFIQHNGVIRNDDDLKKKHDALGINYSTELRTGYVSKSGKVYSDKEKTIWNDSEAIAVETALVLEGQKATIDTEGAAAVIGIQTIGDQVTNRFFFRNTSNPLKFKADSTMIAITSAGAGFEVEPTKLFSLSVVTSTYAPYRDINSPSSFKPYAGADWYKDREWNPITKNFELKKNHMPPLLPAKGEGAGFVPSYSGEDYGIDFGEDNSLRSLADILADVDKISAKRQIQLRNLTYEKLWDEFYDNDEAQDRLKREIATIDRFVEDTGIEIDTLNKRENLQSKLDEVMRYADSLSTELNARESRFPSSVKI